jgi:2-octaprenylphenol hydroxylase
LAEELMALDDDAFCLRLSDAFEHKLGKVVHADKRFSFPLRQRHAIDYIKPGIALVGDACHTIHPLAGQGVNLGFLDVLALEQEIQRACQRNLPLSDESILRRYQRQRKSGNLSMMAAMEGFKRLFGADNIGVRWLRNEGLRQVNSLPVLKNTIVKQAMGL